MTLEITTPALLFPAISLLLLAYTNRFLTTGQLIRGLRANVKNGKSMYIKEQIKNFKKRMGLIKWMQIFGALSLLICTISMFFLFLENELIGKITFVCSLISMVTSLTICIIEIYISTIALKFELRGLEELDGYNN